MLKDDNYFNLTIPQENIWTVEQLNSQTNINNITGIFEIDKILDIDILQKVMNTIVKENDALRIRIKEENGTIKQYITEFEEETFPVYKIDNNDKKDVNKIIKKCAEKRIDIDGDKLYEIILIQNKKTTYVCVKTHHIISDAWTLGQVAEEIKKYYLKISSNELIETNPSYIEFIKRNEKYKSSDKYISDREFWNEYIKNLNCENNFEIPKDKSCKRIEKKIEDNLHNKIIEFCEKNKISEYTFYLAVISVYFSRIYSKESITIGTPFLNRKKIDKEYEIMGMFIATLPIGIQIKKEEMFIQLCKNIGNTTMQCFRHSKYPYLEIQKAYQDFSNTKTNLYEIAFSYQINKLEVEIEGDTGKTTWLANNVQANPLLISYVNHFGEHLFYYDYMLQCFSKENINEIHKRIIHIIEQILEDKDICTKNISILSKEDINLLNKFNRTGNTKQVKENIVSRFNKIVEKNENKTAVICGNKKLTYSELHCKASRLANEILKNNIRNSSIAIILDNSEKFIISILGVLMSGNYYVPILPEEEYGRTEYIIKNCEAKAIISEEKYLEKIQNKEILYLDINENINLDTNNKDENKSNKKIEIKPNDNCYLIYTSGTTGNPKGVVMKHENILSLINSINKDEDLKYLHKDIAISLLKHSFDASAIDIYSSLLNGGTIVIVPKEIELNPKEVVNIIKKENVTRIFTVHKWIEQIQKISIEEHIQLNKLRFIGTGAEVLKPKKFEKLLKKMPKLNIFNTYGPTEATMFITKHKVVKKDLINNNSPIGGLMPNMRALIVNKNNEILPINIQGELVIYQDNESARNLAKGYFKNEDLTNKKFIQIKNILNNQICNAYKTGDMAKINSKLELEFLGRKDDFVKVAGGYLVSLNEVEQKIKEIIGIDIEISTITLPIKNNNNILLFISKNGKSQNIKTEEIKELIDENITFYMRPRVIIEVKEIPRNKNGKVDRRKLEEIGKEYIETNNNIIRPKTGLEQLIYDKVKEIVQHDFSITDDFEDDLGLDSLNMTNLYIKLENSKMTIQDLYNYSSVRDLANMMKTENNIENIKREEIQIINNSKPMKLDNVLLTGITGFVGINLLKELVENEETKKIYCIVRNKIGLTSQERFEETIKKYYNENICKKIKEKVIILNGDLTKEDLGLTKNEYENVTKEINTVINCAANVKHIGKYNKFYRDNVQTVQNLINICKNNNISLAHVSTLSLHGFKAKNSKKIFDENILNIDQTFERSPYLISKYEAEQEIIKASNNKDINAKIFRIGNIMPRLSDGVFQSNYNQNAFMLAIKEINNIGLQTIEMINSNIYLTPVDECAKAINTILKSKCSNLIYHIESDREIQLKDFEKIIRKKGTGIEIADSQEMRKQLYKNYNVGVEHLNEILNKNTNEYSKDITLKVLEKQGFSWKELDNKYLEKIVKIAMKIK